MQIFDNTINKMKKQRNKIKLSKEFKDNLKIMMDEEYNKNEDIFYINNGNNTKNIKLRKAFPKKMVAVFACFVILSTCVFADDLENFFTKLFVNMDSKMSFAIQEGYIQNIDMDYVESNGIKLKVDYLLFDEQSLYIAFNVKTERQFDEILLKDFVLKDENNNVIFDSKNNYRDLQFKMENRIIDKNEIVIVTKIEKKGNNMGIESKAEVCIGMLEIRKSKNIEIINGNWNLKLDIKE